MTGLVNTVFVGLLAIALVFVHLHETKAGLDWANPKNALAMFGFHPLFTIIGAVFITGHSTFIQS